MESSESHTDIDSWSSSTNWIVAGGSIRNSITFESSLSLINDDQNDHSTVNSPAKSPLILYSSSPNFNPCEITENEKVEAEELQEWLKLVVAPEELSVFVKGKQESLLPVKAGL